MDKPETRAEMTSLLQSDGWKLVYSKLFFTSSLEIWEKPGNPYQIRLSWPRNGDCNGATTTGIEIDKALHMMGMEDDNNAGSKAD